MNPINATEMFPLPCDGGNVYISYSPLKHQKFSLILMTLETQIAFLCSFGITCNHVFFKTQKFLY